MFLQKGAPEEGSSKKPKFLLQFSTNIRKIPVKFLPEILFHLQGVVVVRHPLSSSIG